MPNPKLSKKLVKQKHRLDYCIQQLGFNRVMKITHLSGNSLGIYCDLDNIRCIPEHKLLVAESTLGQECQSLKSS